MANRDPEGFNFTMMVTAVSNFIADLLNDEELDLAAAALAQVADTLAAISVLRTFRQNREKNEDSDKEQTP